MTEQQVPDAVMDCTNWNQNSGTMDYVSEVYGLYTALAVQQNIPVDFVDEDAVLDPTQLATFRVLFLTQPNLPAALSTVLLAWVEAGGTLVTTSNAGHWDEYNEQSPLFHATLGTGEVPRQRTVLGPPVFSYGVTGSGNSSATWLTNGSAQVGSAHIVNESVCVPAAVNASGALFDCGNATFGCDSSCDLSDFSCDRNGTTGLFTPTCLCTGCNYTAASSITFQAWGATSNTTKPNGTITSAFADGSPAIVENTVGKGRSVHFFWLPGVSHSAIIAEYNSNRHHYQNLTNSSCYHGTCESIPQANIGKILSNVVEKATMAAPTAAPLVSVTTNMTWVETPLLHGPAGSVVTLLNWSPTGPIKALTVNVSLGFTPSKVESCIHGVVVPKILDAVLSVTVPLENADFLVFTR